jgi:hypothetical protein
LFIGASHQGKLAGQRKRVIAVQIGDTPYRLETRASIGFQADTPLVNRTVLIEKHKTLRYKLEKRVVLEWWLCAPGTQWAFAASTYRASHLSTVVSLRPI